MPPPSHPLSLGAQPAAAGERVHCATSSARASPGLPPPRGTGPSVCSWPSPDEHGAASVQPDRRSSSRGTGGDMAAGDRAGVAAAALAAGEAACIARAERRMVSSGSRRGWSCATSSSALHTSERAPTKSAALRLLRRARTHCGRIRAEGVPSALRRTVAAAALRTRRQCRAVLAVLTVQCSAARERRGKARTATQLHGLAWRCARGSCTQRQPTIPLNKSH